MYNVWLIYDHAGAKKNEDYISYHIELGRKFDFSIVLVYGENVEEKLGRCKPDFAIVRTINTALSCTLEKEGIPIFNNSMVSEICNHKGKTIDYIKKNSNVPCIETKTYKNKELCKELLETHKNCVIKAVDGHGGTQVFLTSDSFFAIKKGIKDSDFIIQPFIKGAGSDLRVYVIGKQIVYAVKRTAKEGFKANFSLGGTVTNYKLSFAEEENVKKICDLFDFGMVGIDFIIDEKEQLIFNEIEDVVGARMLFQCNPQCDLLEQYFTYIREKMLQT